MFTFETDVGNPVMLCTLGIGLENPVMMCIFESDSENPVMLSLIETYAFQDTSKSSADSGINSSPAQNTGVVKTISSMPVKTAPTGNAGQMLL